MAIVNPQCLLSFPHIHPPINRPKPLLTPSSLPSLSLHGKPERLSSLSASLSLSPAIVSSSSSSSFEREEMESVVDGFFYLLRLSSQYHDVEVTRAVHASFLKLGEEKTKLGNALISTYLKLGFPRDAFLVFVSLSSPTVVSYTALISGFARLNLEIKALKVFFRMRGEGVIEPNEYTFVAVLTACVRSCRFSLGVQIHGLIVKSGFLNSVFVCNSVMSLYSSGGWLGDKGGVRRDMGHVMRQLLINPPSSSSILLHRCRTTHDSNYVFSLRTSVTKSKGRFFCLFSGGNQREEQARKALESALGGKKNEFDKWDKEIKKREESGDDGNGGKGGGGGWFGGGGGGWFSGDHFWNEAQQITITLLAILFVYMIVAKGEVMAAFVLNPLLYALRGTREGLTSLSSKLMGRQASKVNGASSEEIWKDSQVSAKESVVRKWGSD